MSKYKEFWICPEIGEIKLKKSNTWPSEQYHVIQIDALIEAQNEIENLKREMVQIKHLANTWFDQNKLLKEALKFYAHSDNWNHINTKTATYAIINEQDLGDGSFQFNDITDDERVGGKLARQTLKKIGEL